MLSKGVVAHVTKNPEAMLAANWALTPSLAYYRLIISCLAVSYVPRYTDPRTVPLSTVTPNP